MLGCSSAVQLPSDALIRYDETVAGALPFSANSTPSESIKGHIVAWIRAICAYKDTGHGAACRFQPASCLPYRSSRAMMLNSDALVHEPYPFLHLQTAKRVL